MPRLRKRANALGSEPVVRKAILLVGGRGTRLAPLTDKTPKPMLHIAGAPVTEHQIRKAAAAGVTEIVLATSYLADVFRPHFGDGADFGVRIHYSFESTPLGTGGAIAMGASQLSLTKDESVYIFNGDVLSGHDLRAQAELHQREDAEITLYLTKVEDARAYGCVPIDGSGAVIDFLEKMENPIADTINAGCYIFRASAFDRIPPAQVTSVERETFPGALRAGARIFGYVDRRYWIDMGTPQSLIRASRDLILNPALSPATRPVIDGAIIEADCQIDKSARISGGSYLQTEVRVEGGAEISGSIIGSGAEIEAGVRIVDSYIAPKTRVVSGSNISGEIFGF